MVLHLPVALAAVSEAVQTILLQVTVPLNNTDICASAVISAVLHLLLRLACLCVCRTLSTYEWEHKGPCWKVVCPYKAESVSLQDAAARLIVP